MSKKTVHDFREVLAENAIKHRLSLKQAMACLYVYKTLTDAYQTALKYKTMESGLVELVMDVTTPVFVSQFATRDECIFSDVDLKTDLIASLKEHQELIHLAIMLKVGATDNKVVPLPMLDITNFRRLFASYVRVVEQVLLFNDAEAERFRKGEPLVSTIHVENDCEYIDLPDSIENYLDYIYSMPSVMLSVLFRPFYDDYIDEMSTFEKERYKAHLEFSEVLNEKSTVSAMLAFNTLREKSIAIVEQYSES